jgi:hypothetical protein
MKTETKDAVALAMDWLAQLRDEESTEPPRGDDKPAAAPAPPAGHSGHAGVPPVPPPRHSGHAAAPPVPPPRHPAQAAAPSEAGPYRRAGTRAGVEITERAAIGDELRIPLAWCEMGSCITHYTDPAALGEADIRARAIVAGWRVDALGRLACPQCQQSDSRFWTAHPVALWDRDTAVAMTAVMAAAVREAADVAARAETDVTPGAQAAAHPPAKGRHRGSRGTDQAL